MEEESDVEAAKADIELPKVELTLLPTGKGDYQPLDTHNASVNARRSGSASILVTNEHGQVTVERKTTDITIALRKRISASSLPSIIPVSQTNIVPPLVNAEDALERLGGKGAAGAYSEHMYPLEVLAEKFQTKLNLDNLMQSPGLTSKRAEELLAQYGPNVLTPPPKLPLWLLFLLQFTNALMVLLQITAVLCLVLYGVNPAVLDNLYLGLLLFVVVFVTCYETYSQEAKADSLMEQFRALVPEQALVLRDGSLQTVEAARLVLGDVLRLQSGDKVPADCRVILCDSLKVDQSMITGEAEPVDVQVVAADPNALEARNLVFNGSLVVDGAALAVVVRTGDATLIGSMVELTGDVGKTQSTLKKDIEHFVTFLTLFALFQAATVFIVGLSRGLDPIQVFINGFVVIMIGNVPQGLPSTITACLYLIAERMKAQNVLVKKLDIIETLGCATCICTDKTGTLTLNLMTVANLWVPSAAFSADEALTAVESNVQVRCLMEIAALNSRVVLEKAASDAASDDAAFTPKGDATELGLYRCCGRWQEDLEAFRAASPKVFEVPFNSAAKWQLSVHRLASQAGKEVVFLKGAPDVLLTKCGFFLDNHGEVQPIDDAFKATFTAAYEAFGGQGERVLGFAFKPLPGRWEELTERDPAFKDTFKASFLGKAGSEPVRDMIFAGLITLQDPPRAEVPQAVKDCQTAGIQVVMVTGDHPLTAAAIARKIGLLSLPTREDVARERGVPVEAVSFQEAPALVVHGATIAAMTEEDWTALLAKKEVVFARTSPEQKLTIVQRFTAAGHVTAMTGDGVNDSPALKQAAIGIAMGRNGSAVAKEAADVVLLDDNFASIVVGVREGRLLFANLKKSIAYTLTHLVPEVLPVLFWGYGGIPQPMASMQALCIDLLTELVPATSFAFEGPESLIMQQPPRNLKTDRLTSFRLLFYSYGQAGIILTAACFFVYFRAFSHFGVSPQDVMSSDNRYFPQESDDQVFISDSGEHMGHRDQLHVLQSVQTAWFLTIVIGQAAHVWVCRTTTVSIFKHGFFSNSVTNYGVVVAIAMAVLVVHCPGIIYVVGARPPLADISLTLFYAALWVTAALWSYTEGRKWFTRTYPTHWLNRLLAW